MDIAAVLTKDCIDLEMDAHNKDEVFDAMSNMLLRAGKLSSKEEFLKDVYFRESKGSTGIGEGIAIPHGKSGSVLKTSLAMARTKEPIDWESLDDKPVRFIIMFAVRDADKTTVHVKMLGEVAGKLADDGLTERLLTSNDPQEVISFFSHEQ